MSKLSEFEKIRDLFVEWAVTGVPKGVEYPRTQTEAVGWKCPQFGVMDGVGSKAYFKTTHPEFGTIVKEIGALTAKLKPVDEVRKLARQAEKAVPATKPSNVRVYKTQGARRKTAEDLAESLTAENLSLLTQLQLTRSELTSVKLNLAIQEQTSNRLASEKAKLEADNAKLTRMVAEKRGLLKIVE